MDSAQSYTYDSNGNLSSVATPGTATLSYGYSGADLISQVTRGSGTFSYGYDSAGNLLSKTKTTGSGTDTYTYGDSTWKDLLTAYNGSTISYDAIGNPTTWYDGATMTWANGRRLASISATSDHGAQVFWSC